MSYYFSMIGTKDVPIYELEFGSFKMSNQVPGKSQFSKELKELLPFISHASIDLIEEVQWNNNQFHLGRIDSFYGTTVHAFLTQGNIKLIICTDSTGKIDDSIRQFFIDTNELYVKCLMNPFYSVNDSITGGEFDLKVKMLARKYF